MHRDELKVSKTETLTRARLVEKLEYCAETGTFRWVSGISPPSKVQLKDRDFSAGARCREGYIHIKIDGVAHKAHRLAWLFVHGEHPVGVLDHINGIRDDNRIANLRLATVAQNKMNSGIQSNNTTGARGVRRTKAGSFEAAIKVNGRVNRLGIFKTITEAAAAYNEAARKEFGSFVRGGSL